MLTKTAILAFVLVVASMLVGVASVQGSVFALNSPTSGASAGHMVLEPLELDAGLDLGQALAEATWYHPHLGDFHVTLTKPLHQVVQSVGSFGENGQLVQAKPTEYLLTVPDTHHSGRITIGPDFVGGYLLTNHGDIEITGTNDGTWHINLGMSSVGKDFVEPVELDPTVADSAPFGIRSDEVGSGSIPTYTSSCYGLSNDDAARIATASVVDACLEAEEAIDVPVGDDNEATANLIAPSLLQTDSQPTYKTDASAPTIKVRVYHQGKSSRASSDCDYANDRIFEEETGVRLECDLVNLGTRHDAGTSYGYDDWLLFIHEYYSNAGGFNYKSNTIAYNGGRFVAFMPDEATWHSTAYGGTRDCGDPNWSATSENDPCGHLSIYNNGATYWDHSAAYREGQTFAHEMIHDLNVASTGYTGHDDTTASKNYNGDEHCSGKGDDFVSWNVFYYTGDGAKCSHRHFWVAPAPSNVEADIPKNAAIHASKY